MAQLQGRPAFGPVMRRNESAIGGQGFKGEYVILHI